MTFRFVGSVLLRNPIPWLDRLGAKATYYHRTRIGKREVLGFGLNGTEVYYDRLISMIPPIRFKEPSNESKCLQAKEALDWNKLSMEEKKALYRYSFCQTIIEYKSFTQIWKVCVAWGFWAVTLSLWYSIFCWWWVYDDMPITYDDEHQMAQLKRIIALEPDPHFGLCSKWDYNHNRWK